MPQPAERHWKEVELILEAKVSGQRLHPEDLRKKFGVSLATIYSDLEVLSKLRVVRSRGAIELRTESDALPPRFSSQADLKSLIAQEVVERRIDLGAVTFLDTGSTCFHIAKSIVEHDRQDIRLVTANPFALSMFVEAGVPQEVIALGGLLRREAASFHGALTQYCANQFAYDVAIISVDFIHSDNDITLATFSDAEVAQKQVAIRQATSVVVVADSTKLGRSVGHPVVALGPLRNTKTLHVIIGADEGERPEDSQALARLRRALGNDAVTVVEAGVRT